MVRKCRVTIGHARLRGTTRLGYWRAAGDDRRRLRHGEERQCGCAEGDEAGGSGYCRQVGRLSKERPGCGADEGGRCLAGEEYGAHPAEYPVRDDPLQGGLLDDQRHGAAQADGDRGRQRGGER
jgi:hypothetical protein